MNAFSKHRAAQSLGDQFGMTTAAVLRCGLESAHKYLAECIAQVETVTSAREPDMAELSHARFRISQAGFAKAAAGQPGLRPPARTCDQG